MVSGHGKPRALMHPGLWNCTPVSGCRTGGIELRVMPVPLSNGETRMLHLDYLNMRKLRAAK
jgi:hypothetical protein